MLIVGCYTFLIHHNRISLHFSACSNLYNPLTINACPKRSNEVRIFIDNFYIRNCRDFLLPRITIKVVPTSLINQNNCVQVASNFYVEGNYFPYTGIRFKGSLCVYIYMLENRIEVQQTYSIYSISNTSLYC